MRELFERAEQASEISFRDLHIALDAMPIALSWSSLPGGKIQFVNRAFKRLFGYSERDFATVEQWINETSETDEERKITREHWAILWNGRQTGVEEIAPLECRVLRADGTFSTIVNRGTLLWDIGIAIATFEDISDRKLAEDVMLRIALEDPLTQLANRRAVIQHWETKVSGRRKSIPQMLAVIIVDLDGFKPINDRLGHDAGDRILRLVAGRLNAAVRNTDLVGRIGGDEFVILLSSLKDAAEAEDICRLVTETFAVPFDLDEETITLGVSVGASLYPQDGSDLISLMRQADEALYRRKRGGRGGWEWFTFPAA